MEAGALELFSKKGVPINFAKLSEIFKKSHFAEHLRITDFVSKRPQFYDGTCTRIIFNYVTSNFIDIKHEKYFKINNENPRTICEMCSKITMKAAERYQ